MGSEDKQAKKEKREARSPEDAAAREAKKAAKKAKIGGGDGGGGGGDGHDGRVPRVRVSPVPPNSDVASIAAFLGVDASKVVVLSGEATAIMPDDAAAHRAAQALDETKFKGRFVRVTRDDFTPGQLVSSAAGEATDTHAETQPRTTDDPRGGSSRSATGVVEVECCGQTGRIIGKGGSKIREIEELTGCLLRVRQEDGICEVSGRDVNAAVQEIKNIVQEGRERDGGGVGGGGWGGETPNNQFGASSRELDFGNRNVPPPSSSYGQSGPAGTGTGTSYGQSSHQIPGLEIPQTNQPLPFGVPPPGSASRHDLGANDWACPCGSTNFARRGSCFKCGAPRSGGAGAGGGSGGIASSSAIPSRHTQQSAQSQQQSAQAQQQSAQAQQQSAQAQQPGGALNAPSQTQAGDGFEVFVKYLPHETTDFEVSEFFQRYGTLQGDPRLIRDTNGRCKGAGFVTFVTETSRNEALKNDGVRFGGRHLSISVAKTGTFGVRATEQKAGTHTPAMLFETIDMLVKPDKDGTYVDGTFGRGGHSRGILNALGPSGKLHAFDMDPEAIAEGRKLEKEDARFHIHHAPFGCMDVVLKKLGVTPCGVFLDLGISSPQFDDYTRGFRPEQDGPVDLRFDLSSGEPASTFLQKVERDDLIKIIHDFGETSDPIAARRVADAIVLAREHGNLPCTTKAFATLVASAKGKEYQAMHPAKLTFQALRIFINQEFDEMKRGLRAAFEIMGDGGRLGVLTWKHSECALLTDFTRAFEKARLDSPLAAWFAEHHPADFHKVLADTSDGWAVEADDVSRPSDTEMKENSRSRSAILHVLRKRSGAARTANVETAVYLQKKWTPPPKAPEPPKTTFAYQAVDSKVSKDAVVSASKDSKKEDAKSAKKKDKKDKKRGSKWAEA